VVQEAQRAARIAAEAEQIKKQEAALQVSSLLLPWYM
jgi:hypothetical protein